MVGVLVFGSVAMGDADLLSDIDMTVVVEGDSDEWRARGKADVWREGVYLDVTLASAGNFGNAGKVLGEAFAAAQMNDGLILYDPSGELTRPQEDVRAVYMEPKRVAGRVQPVMRWLREQLTDLRTAVAAGDMMRTCPHLRGITPSPAETLLQLDRVAPELTDRFRQ